MAMRGVKVQLSFKGAEAFVPKGTFKMLAEPVDVDAHVWLSGNEDCSVDVQCRTCDRGGEPVAWYGGANPYDEGRVPTARTIYQLYALAYQHVRDVHGEPS